MGRRVSIRHLHWTGLPSSCCGRQPRLPLLCALLRPPLGGHLGPSRAAQRSALPSRSPWAGNPPPGPEWLCSGFAEGLHQRRVRPPCWPATSCSGSSGTARNWPGATAALPAAGCYVTRLRGMSFLPTSRPPATGAAAPEKVSGAAPEGGRSCPDGARAAGQRPAAVPLGLRPWLPASRGACLQNLPRSHGPRRQSRGSPSTSRRAGTPVLAPAPSCLRAASFLLTLSSGLPWKCTRALRGSRVGFGAGQQVPGVGSFFLLLDCFTAALGSQTSRKCGFPCSLPAGSVSDLLCPCGGVCYTDEAARCSVTG